jgi:TPR repeat protein
MTLLDSSLWCVLLLLLLATSAFATPADVDSALAHAQELVSAGDYSSAYDEYLRIAEQDNHPLAQFSVALFYDYGWGRDVDRAMACQWYAKAAAGHIPAAQHFYADCLLEKVNGPADPEEAAYWYEQAAENGHIISLCSLAEMYIFGRGVPVDIEKGLSLCQGVAEQGLVTAMVRMGRIYLEEDGQLRDYDKAYYWFEEASLLANPTGQYQLGLMHRDGVGRDADSTTARYWFESAASKGFVPAYYQTGLLYFNAPLDPVANKLHPDFLAKAYLWLSAATARSDDKTEVHEAAELLGEIKKDMPASWLPSLNEKLAEHLAQNQLVQ